MKIKVPASSGNIGIGFDVFGMSIDIFNEYDVTFSTSFQLDNQEIDPSTHLIFDSYIKACDYFGVDVKPILLKIVKEEIPQARGLGSSSACIAVGVKIVIEMFDLNTQDEKIAKLLINLEGHPDNVIPTYFGGCISTLCVNDTIYMHKMNPSNSYHYYVLIPEKMATTKSMRNALPSQYKKEDVVSQMAKISFFEYAITTNQFKLLKDILVDHLHEPYRLPLLNIPNEILRLKDRDDLILLLSGSGSSLLLISETEFQLDNPCGYKQIKVHPYNHPKITIKK
jgi:homoserine kinase